MKNKRHRQDKSSLPDSRTLSLAVTATLALTVVASSVNAKEVLTDNEAYKQVADTVQPSESDNATLPKVTVEADAETDAYDPTNTNDPYNKSYSVTNSSTSTKTDTPIMDTPASIQVIPKSVMHDQQAYRLEDVIKNVSGVQTWHAFGGDYEGFVMRGFQQSIVNYRNGIRIPFTKFDLANVERVEVLKGTSAMLYGFGDPGGFISTVTKQPSSEPYYSIEQRFGSYDFYRTEASATGPLSKEHGLNYRIDLSYLDAGSFRKFIDRDRIFFAPSLSWQATVDTKLTLSYEHFDEDNSMTTAFLPLAQVPRSRTFGQPGTTNTNTTDLIDFRIDHRVNDKIKLNAGTVYAQNKKQWETIYLSQVNEDDPKSPDYGNVNRNYWFGPEKIDTLTAWINGAFDFETYGVKHKVLLGGEYHNTNLDYHIADGKADTINIFTFEPSTSNLPIDQFRNLPTNTYHISTENTSRAIYLQDQMTFWEKLHILGGFRYDWVDRKQNLTWWAPEGKDARNDTFISPRVALLYEATDWLSVFAVFQSPLAQLTIMTMAGRIFTPSFRQPNLKADLKPNSLTAN